MRKKMELVLLATLLSISTLTACGNTSKNVESDTDTTTMKEESSKKEKKTKYDEVTSETQKEKSSETEDKVEYDEPTSVVDMFYKAKLDFDSEKAASYCTDSIKDEECEKINKLNEKIESDKVTLKTELLDIFVPAMQDVLDYFFAEDDYIDLSYLYNDSDLNSALDDLLAYVSSHFIFYTMPNNAKMLPDNSAVVTVDISKPSPTNSASITSRIEGRLVGSTLKKLVNDLDSVKEAVAKEVIRQFLVDTVKEIKNLYVEAEIVPYDTKTYYLTNSSGEWLIYKVEDGNISSQDEYSADYNETDYSDEYYEENSSKYIIPNSDSEYLTEDNLCNLSSKELTYARNEIYARHGYVFKSAELNSYFGNQNWYKIDYEYDGKLSDVEVHNAELISNYQKENNLTYVPQ